MSRFAEIDYNVINNVFTCDVCTPLRFHRDSSNFRNISPMLISRIMLIRSSGHSRWRPSAVKNSLGRVAVALFYWKGSGTGTRENVTGNDGEITGEHWRICFAAVNRQLNIEDEKTRRVTDCKIRWSAKCYAVVAAYVDANTSRVGKVRGIPLWSARYKSSFTPLHNRRWRVTHLSGGSSIAALYSSLFSSLNIFIRYVKID